MICSACEKFAAQSGTVPPLCGNCALLKPEQLKQVHKTRDADKKIASGTTEPGKVIAELQQENAQLKADNAALQEQLDSLTAPNKAAAAKTLAEDEKAADKYGATQVKGPGPSHK